SRGEIDTFIYRPVSASHRPPAIGPALHLRKVTRQRAHTVFQHLNHATLQPMQVLVIEDDPDISRSVRAGLERAGYEAHYATDGNTGLRMATSTPYDAAVVDLMLPGVDGLTLIETMRARQVMTPIIVLSAKRSTDDKVT